MSIILNGHINKSIKASHNIRGKMTRWANVRRDLIPKPWHKLNKKNEALSRKPRISEVVFFNYECK